MEKVERSVTVDAPVEKVFDYIVDPSNGPEFITSTLEVNDVTRTEQGVGTHYRWTYKLAGMRMEGESTFTECVPNKRLVSESKGGIPSTWTYTFEPQGDRTRMTTVIEYTIPIPVLGKVAEALVLKQKKREASMAMKNIKATMEG